MTSEVISHLSALHTAFYIIYLVSLKKKLQYFFCHLEEYNYQHQTTYPPQLGHFYYI